MSRPASIWNDDKINFLVEHYAYVSNRKLADALGVSVPSTEADILKMSERNSYRSVADKLSLSVSSVQIIINKAVAKGHQKRSKEETLKIMSDTRVRLIKKERARAIFGLEQKTKLKLFPNKQKYKVRERLKRSRYDVECNGTDVYIDDETRRHAKIEAEAQKLGFQIIKPVVEYYPIDFMSENGPAEEQIFAELKRKNING